MDRAERDAAGLNELPTGRIELSFCQKAGRTESVKRSFSGLLRASRPYYRSSRLIPEMQLIHLGPGNLAGDHYEQFIHVEAEACACIGYQSATKILPGALGSTHSQYILLDHNSRLLLRPNVLIPFENSNFKSQTVIDMKADSKLSIAEIVSGGWGPARQAFRFNQLSTKLKIYVEGRLVVWDHLHLNHQTMPQAGGWAGQYNTSGTLYLLGCEEGKEAQLLELLSLVVQKQGGVVEAGVSRLTECGVVVRALGKTADQLVRLFEECTERVYQYGCN